MARVLVVEDGPELRALLEFRLRQSGHQVVSAASGEEALGVLAEKEAPDVAVLDVLLPGMTGLELHSRLRQDPNFARVPVVFLSGRVQPADIAAGNALGATYLTKPVVVSSLNKAIDRALLANRTDPGTW
jgi:CheY-like chemotaxis protein